MLSVCRLCARWGEPFAEMDTILVENLQPNKAIMRMFGFDVSNASTKLLLYPSLDCALFFPLLYSFLVHHRTRTKCATNVFKA